MQAAGGGSEETEKAGSSATVQAEASSSAAQGRQATPHDHRAASKQGTDTTFNGRLLY